MCDKNVTFNGFDVCHVVVDGLALGALQVTGVATEAVPALSAATHLREILQLMLVANNRETLVRPRAVLAHLRDKAREAALAPDDDPAGLLGRFMAALLPDDGEAARRGHEHATERILAARCPHGAPIAHRLWTMSGFVH